jgi:hypothetical protein
VQKTYEGFSLPDPTMVRYSIEWSCASCGSGDVEREAEDNRPLSWCDGRPCTEDQLRRWTCNACSATANGRDLNQKESGFEVLYTLGDGPADRW